MFLNVIIPKLLIISQVISHYPKTIIQKTTQIISNLVQIWAEWVIFIIRSDQVCDWERLPGSWTHPESCGRCQDSDKPRQTNSNFHDPPLTQWPGPLSMELAVKIRDILLCGAAGHFQFGWTSSIYFLWSSIMHRGAETEACRHPPSPLRWTIQFICARKVNHEFNLNHLFIQFSK